MGERSRSAAGAMHWVAMKVAMVVTMGVAMGVATGVASYLEHAGEGDGRVCRGGHGRAEQECRRCNALGRNEGRNGGRNGVAMKVAMRVAMRVAMGVRSYLEHAGEGDGRVRGGGY